MRFSIAALAFVTGLAAAAPTSAGGHAGARQVVARELFDNEVDANNARGGINDGADATGGDNNGGGDEDTANAVDQLIAAGPSLFDNEVDANNN